MLKQAFYGLSALSFITFLSCSKIALISIGRDIVIAVGVNALSAGQTFSEPIDVPTIAIKEALKEKGGSSIQLEELKVDTVTLVIPDTTAWTFAAIESVDIGIEGKSVGPFPAGSTGKRLVFAVPADFPNLTTNISDGSPIKVNIIMKAKNATTATKLAVTFRLAIDASLSR